MNGKIEILRGTARGRVPFLAVGTALGGAVAAMLLVHATAAEAADDCGAPVDGIATCTPDGNPYGSGIFYDTDDDLTLKVEDGVALAGRFGVRVDGKGDAAVTLDIAPGASIGSDGFLSSAVTGNSDTGDIRIDARGPLTAKGFLASGIRAVSRDGAISILSGDMATEGGTGISVGGSERPVSIEATGHIRSLAGTVFGGVRNAVSGIFVSTQGEVRIENSGKIEVDAAPTSIPGTTLGLAADGIHIETGGQVAVTGTGEVVTTGFNSQGIFAQGSDIRVEHAEVSTFGEEATAIVARGTDDVSVDVGHVSSARFDAIAALSANGDVDVVFDELEAQRIGILAVSTLGSIQVTAGSASVDADQAFAIGAQAGADVDVSVEGEIVAVSGQGIVVTSGGKATVDIAAGASVQGTDALNLTSDLGSRVRNQGEITGGSGFAVFADVAAVTIENTGTISGRLDLANGDDLVVNDGDFATTGISDVREGFDELVNNGRIKVHSQDDEQGFAVLAGLEHLENSGVIDQVDGRADGYLELPGDYVGSNGVLELDVSLAAGSVVGADQLILDGAATGRTLISPYGLDGQNGLLTPEVAVVFAGEGSSPDAFTTDGLNVGFVEYGIVFDEADTVYSLVGGPGDAAYRTVKILEGARNLWYESSDGWSAQMREARDNPGAGTDGQFWTQAYGAVDKRSERRDTSFSGVSADADLSYRQDFFGGQIGYDRAVSEPITIGATAGYIHSNLDFEHASSEVEYDAINAGVYAAYRSGPFFANILGKVDHYRIEARDPSIDFDRKLDGYAVGVTGEAGWRHGTERLFLEPFASLSYVHAEVDDLSALSTTFDFDEAEGFRGKIGARTGSGFDIADGTHLSFYAGAAAVTEFGGRDSALMRNNGEAAGLSGRRIGTYGEAVAGLDIQGRNGVSGFLEGFGDFGDSADLRGGGGRGGLRIAF